MTALYFRNQLLDQFQLLDLDFDNAMILFFDTNSFQHKWNISILLSQKRGSDMKHAKMPTRISLKLIQLKFKSCSIRPHAIFL